MAATLPQSEPSTIIAGDTAKWQVFAGDYLPASGWTLTYSLTSRTGNKVSVVATANGTYHDATLNTATTANMSAELWSFQGRFSNATESYTVRQGTIDVAENFAAMRTVFDGRSHARKTLDLIEAQLEGRAADGIESHSIGGVPINLIPLTELRVLRDKYYAEVLREEDAEKIRRGLSSGRNIFVRFTSR